MCRRTTEPIGVFLIALAQRAQLPPQPNPRTFSYGALLWAKLIMVRLVLGTAARVRTQLNSILVTW